LEDHQRKIDQAHCKDETCGGVNVTEVLTSDRNVTLPKIDVIPREAQATVTPGEIVPHDDVVIMMQRPVIVTSSGW
jgi:hypothetical protein